MIPMINHKWMKKYLDVLAASNAAGHTKPSFTQRRKQNWVVIQFYFADIWDDLDVFWMFANDGSQDFARFNWITPGSFKCTLVNAPTFTSNAGFKSDGATSYVETGWAPNDGVKYTQNDALFVSGTTDDIAEAGVMFGVDGTTALNQRTFLNPENASNVVRFTVNDQPVGTSLNNSSAGCYVGYRVDANIIQLYHNGVLLDGSISSTSQTRSLRTMVVCAFKGVLDAIASYGTRNVNYLGFGNQMDINKRGFMDVVLNNYMATL